MTVIAWDGKTLAADKRSVNNGRPTTVTKIFRSDDMLLAVTGDLVRGLELVRWHQAGGNPATLPEFQKTLADYVPLLQVSRDGVYLYENGPIPFKVEEPFFAMGSGRDCALAALYLGKTAKEAVEVACVLLNGCGNGIDTLELG